MPPPYRNPHWTVFSGIPHVPAGLVGRSPASWATTYGLSGIPIARIALPTYKLNRADVRTICQDPSIPVLFGYVCAMAWGGQGSGPGGAKHAKAAWDASGVLGRHLGTLRSGNLSRCAAYRLFLGGGAVPGIGPAYFTKLLYFFSPEPDHYIMDQWTAKSVNLLTGHHVVRMGGNAVSNQNTCGNYEAYCEEVDAIAAILGVSGEDAEEMMMSKGGRKKWLWRQHVVSHWATRRPAHRYNRGTLRTTYPRINPNCF